MGEDKKRVWDRIKNQYTCRLGECPDEITVRELLNKQFETVKGIPGNTVAETVRTLIMHPSLLLEVTATPEWKAEVRTQCLSLIAETTELLETTPWKPWRKAHTEGRMTEEQVQDAKLEVVDQLCFMLNLFMLLGGNGQELALLHQVKCEENLRRQKEAY